MNVNIRVLKATIEFLWWMGWVEWWGSLHSPFCVQPNYSVEVVLSCVVVWVVAILICRLQVFEGGVESGKV